MVWVKFVRSHEAFVRGDVAGFDEAAAASFVRKGIAVVAPRDLWPSSVRQAEYETGMVVPLAEHAVTRERRG